MKKILFLLMIVFLFGGCEKERTSEEIYQEYQELVEKERSKQIKEQKMVSGQISLIDAYKDFYEKKWDRYSVPKNLSTYKYKYGKHFYNVHFIAGGRGDGLHVIGISSHDPECEMEDIETVIKRVLSEKEKEK